MCKIVKIENKFLSDVGRLIVFAKPGSIGLMSMNWTPICSKLNIIWTTSKMTASFLGNFGKIKSKNHARTKNVIFEGQLLLKMQ